MQSITEFISALSPFWIYTTILFFAWLENILPPVPSDLVIVFSGSLVTLNLIEPIPLIIFTTIGSSFGFFTMYLIGNKFGKAIVNNQFYKFISAETLDKIEKWFVKYGFSIIILNRFLSGTRAFISFAAGILHLHLPTTLFLATISSLIWNLILIYFGVALGTQWNNIGIYLTAYGQIITGVLLVIVVSYYAWQLFIKSKK